MRKTFLVGREEAGQRLDVFLAHHFPTLSRSQLEKLVRAGEARVEGRLAKPSHRLSQAERVEVALPPASSRALLPEPRPLDIRYEDDDLLVVNKPQGLVVHPGAGRSSGTLVNALLAHCPQLTRLGGELRPGIVHRLDKDTSGLLVVAKSDDAYLGLKGQIQRREVERRYLAIVWGDPERDEFFVSAPIARDPRKRTQMSVASEGLLRPGARLAVTEVMVRERFGLMGLLEAKLVTGRTHQIRVHLSHLGHPVMGDPTYGRRIARKMMHSSPPDLRQLVGKLPGQALHAYRLSFTHPLSGEKLSFEAELPAPIAELLSWLRSHSPADQDQPAWSTDQPASPRISLERVWEETDGFCSEVGL